MPTGPNIFADFLTPVLLGHRGAKDYAPENSIEAFELALAHGCDGFELDVRLSADGQAVICHDARFRHLTIASERSEMLALRGMPLLADVVREFGKRAFMDIELKVAGLEQITLDLLREYPADAGFVITSFLPEVLRELRRLDADIPLGLICRNEKQLSAAHQLAVDTVVLHSSLVSSEELTAFRKRGIPVLAWAANSESHMRSLVEAGVSSLIIDDTKLAVATFRKRALAAGVP